MTRRVLPLVGLAALSITVHLVNEQLQTAVDGGQAAPFQARDALIFFLLVAQAAVLWWRRSHPVVSFLAVFALHLGAVVATGSRDSAAPTTLWFAVFWLVARVPRRRTGVIIALAALVEFVMQIAQALVMGTGEASSTLSAVIVARLITVMGGYVFMGAAGWVFEALRQRSALAAENARLVAREHDAQVAAALALERNRMARELHDVAAHHLTGIIVQTKAALQRRDSLPDPAITVLEFVREEGQRTLESLREVVGVLRKGGGPEPEPRPSLSQLPDLLESLQQVNRDVTVSIEGTLDDLPAASSLACFRIIQESVTNAAKHSPGAPVNIRAVRGPQDVRVEVANGASVSGAHGEFVSPNSGYGLLGMRERVEMLGGTLSAGATPDGGWVTRATIPVAAKEKVA